MSEAGKGRVITVRCRQDLHERLKDRAHDSRDSLNAMIVRALYALLEQPIVRQGQSVNQTEEAVEV
jgi:predicted HicB family RNase H-like nuclease